MNIIKKCMKTLIFFFVFPCLVYADCISDFKEIEKDFKITYEYNEETDDYTITFFNPSYERYSYAQTSWEEIRNSKRIANGKSQTIIVEHYKDTKYYYKIKSLYEGCNQVTVKEDTIELKNYNPYSDSPLCEGNEEFVLCQKDYDKKIDEETFKSRLDTYIKTKEEKESSTAEEKNDNNSNTKETSNNIVKKATSYIETHLTEIIIAVTVIVILIIAAILYIKKIIKGRRLE